MADGGLVIMAGERVWYGKGKPPVSAPVGKGRGLRKTTGRSRASSRVESGTKHPIFAAAMALTDDPYWKSVLLDMSQDRFLRGFRYVNGLLTYKNRNKTLDCPIDQTDPRVALSQVLTFLHEQGYYSARDNEHKDLEFRRSAGVQAPQIDSWSQVKTPAHRTLLINNFIEEIMKLDPQINAKDLHGRIRLGIAQGYFNASTILVSNNRIVNIDGLIRDDKGRFHVDLHRVQGTIGKDKSISPSADSPSESVTPNLLQGWSRFLLQYEKRISRHV